MRFDIMLAHLILLLPVAVLSYQKLHDLQGGLVVGLILLVLYVLGLSQLLRTPEKVGRLTLSSVVIGCAGAVATYLLSVHWGYGPFVASGIVGIFAARFLTLEHSIIAYAAAFVGMSSALTVPEVWMIALAGAIIGVIYDYTSDCFKGIGGKLGTLAASAVLVVLFLF